MTAADEGATTQFDGQNSLALLETLVQHAPMGFALVDRDLRYVRVNDELAASHGLPVAAHVGVKVEHLVPGLWPDIRGYYERALAGETVQNHDLSGQSLKGAFSHWLLSYYPVRVGTEVVGVGVIVNDISERRRAEQALVVRNSLYEMLARTSGAVHVCRSETELFQEVCSIVVETGHFCFAWVGKAMNGRVEPVASAGDDGGYMKTFEVTLDANDPRSRGPIGRAFLSGESFVINDIFSSAMAAFRRDDARRSGFASGAVFPIRSGERVVAVLTVYAKTPGFFTDDLVEALGRVTPGIEVALASFERQQELERESVALRMRDRAIGESSQGIILTDPSLPSNPIVYASPGFERMTGYTTSEAVGKPYGFLEGAETDAEAVVRLRYAIASGRGCAVEYLNYRKVGVAFWNALTVSPVHDDAGRLTNFVGVHTDVTERRNLEGQLRRAQKMEAIGRLAAGFAHDFNNLLSVVKSYTSLVLMDKRGRASADEDLTQVLHAADRAADLTRQMLALGRQQVLLARVVDLAAAILGMEKMLRRLLGPNVKLDTSGVQAGTYVRADPTQLEQIVLTLADNARDAMPAGGRVALGLVEIAELPKDTVRWDAETTVGPYVRLTFADSGVGMDVQTLDRIFEPFFTTKGSGRGTGLGLATVFGIVKQSRGHIAVASEVGRGTTFSVYLPRVDAPTDAALPYSERPLPLGTETVLLVDDESQVREACRVVLTRHGYRVLDASNAGEALLIFEQDPASIDLLMTDIELPRMSGRALAERLRRDRPSLKVLLMSGTMSEGADGAGRIQEQGFLPKPLSPNALLCKVREVLDGSGERHGEVPPAAFSHED